MKSLVISTQLIKRFATPPLPLALQSREDFQGQGVTLALLDAAFTPHPDLVMPDNRILAYYDATGEDTPLDGPITPVHWHGTMTSVVAGGNGFLSDGLFRSLAPQVQLVLIKTWGRQGISENTIVNGLRWLINHREQYNIRILTTSVQANDQIVSAWDDECDLLLETLVGMGVAVVCAAGNDFRVSTPPGNSPSVITVGGVSLQGRHLIPYDPSCFGETVDGFMKPEVVALAGQVAAPILPGTEAASSADALTRLANASLEEAQALAAELWQTAGLEQDPSDWEPGDIIECAAQSLLEQSILTPFYKSVDGTSFAAPIVASVIAQMLQANPALHPRQIKQILMQTADLVEDVPRERQGFGLINPKRAVERALEQPQQRPQTGWFRMPERQGRRTLFQHFRPVAHTVCLAGNFNGWQPQPMQRLSSGVWELSLPLPPGSYAYKFVIDDEWQQDPNNMHLAPDGVGGFNSVLEVT